MDTEFTVIMGYDCSGRVYVARVPALRGVVSEGASKHEAVSNIKDAIGEWIAARRAAGLPMTQAREYRVKIPG